MLTVFSQIIILFIFIAIGYALGKWVIKDTSSSKLLSTLLVYIFLPANIIKIFATRFNVATLKSNAVLLAVSASILLTVAVLSHFAAKLFSKDKSEQKIFDYTLITPNYSYMGYAVAEALFGEDVLFTMMMFALPLIVHTYTRGYIMLSGEKLSPKRLLNPILISVVAGMLIGLSGFTMPEFADNVLDKSRVCLAPVSMLLTGITVSAFSLKDVFLDRRAYIVSFIRLLLIPTAICLSLKALGLTEFILPATIIYCMPCGLNTIVIPKLYGGNCKIGASCAVISNIFAFATIPFCISILINI